MASAPDLRVLFENDMNTTESEYSSYWDGMTKEEIEGQKRHWAQLRNFNFQFQGCDPSQAWIDQSRNIAYLNKEELVASNKVFRDAKLYKRRGMGILVKDKRTTMLAYMKVAFLQELSLCCPVVIRRGPNPMPADGEGIVLTVYAFCASPNCTRNYKAYVCMETFGNRRSLIDKAANKAIFAPVKIKTLPHSSFEDGMQIFPRCKLHRGTIPFIEDNGIADIGLPLAARWKDDEEEEEAEDAEEEEQDEESAGSEDSDKAQDV